MNRRLGMVAAAVLAAVALALWRNSVDGRLLRGRVLLPAFTTAPSIAARPPDDRPLLWVQPPEDIALDSLRLRASDWDGNEMGSLALHCLAPCTVKPSPDGQRLLVRAEGMRLLQLAAGEASLTLQQATIFDSSGAMLATVASETGDYSWSWADDSRHLCVLRQAPSTEGLASSPELDLVDADNGDRGVVSAAVAPASPPPSAAAYQSWNVLACSVIADRAVIAEDGPDGIGGVVVIRLSSGDVLYSRDDHRLATPLGLFPVEAITVSADGGLAVEQLTAGGLVLRNLSSGAVTPWPGARQEQPGSVSALSWHGRLAVTDGGVVDLDSGRVIWRPVLATPMSPEQNELPGGDDVVVTVGGNELVVRSDGSAVGLWAAFQPLGLPCGQLSAQIAPDRVIVLC